jgi:D-inositol-3-phosphate glycosyltransferase
MKITVIGPVFPYRGGIAQFATSLAAELLAAGHEVQVISFARQYPRWLYPGQSDKDPSQQHEQVTARFILDPLYPWTWLSVVRQVGAFQPDLVVFQWWITFWSPAYAFITAALRRQKISCAAMIHNVLPHEKRFVDVWLARLTLAQMKACITLSPKEAGRLRELLPSAAVYTSRLPVGRGIPTRVDRSAARQSLGLNADQPVLLFFGLVRRYKGLAVLLEALGRLKTTECNPYLLVVGEFWDDVIPYQQQIERLGLADQVQIDNRFVPAEELGRYFGAADTLVAPYLNGTQSAVIKTAMGAGLPVLASDQISSDLQPDTYPIFIHRAGDVADLADSIQAFFAHPPAPAPPPGLNGGWQELIDVITQAASTR